MLLKIAMIKGDKKRRITICKPIDENSPSLLNDLYPHTTWLSTLPFDTTSFTLFVSDKPLGDAVAVKLPPVPYIKPAGPNYSRFEIRAGKERHIGTSMEHPVTQLLLKNEDLDPDIIAEKRQIYLGVGPAETSEVTTILCLPEEPRLIVDTPEDLGLDTTIVVCPPEEIDTDKTEPVTVIKRIEDDLTDEELAERYLSFFLQHYVAFFKGAKLSSEQLHTAIETNAPYGVRADLLDRKTVTIAFRERFGTGMGRASARIEGKVSKYWQDFEVRIHHPDPLERFWYV